jgi:hypothetical protein
MSKKWPQTKIRAGSRLPRATKFNDGLDVVFEGYNMEFTFIPDFLAAERQWEMGIYDRKKTVF